MRLSVLAVLLLVGLLQAVSSKSAGDSAVAIPGEEPPQPMQDAAHDDDDDDDDDDDIRSPTNSTGLDSANNSKLSKAERRQRKKCRDNPDKCQRNGDKQEMRERKRQEKEEKRRQKEEKKKLKAQKKAEKQRKKERKEQEKRERGEQKEQRRPKKEGRRDRKNKRDKKNNRLSMFDQDEVAKNVTSEEDDDDDLYDDEDSDIYDRMVGDEEKSGMIQKRSNRRRQGGKKRAHKACTTAEDCGAGKCCITNREGQKICAKLNYKPVSRRCLDTCTCAEGLQCYSSNTGRGRGNNQRAQSVGHCTRSEEVDLTTGFVLPRTT